MTLVWDGNSLLWNTLKYSTFKYHVVSGFLVFKTHNASQKYRRFRVSLATWKIGGEDCTHSIWKKQMLQKTSRYMETFKKIQKIANKTSNINCVRNQKVQLKTQNCDFKISNGWKWTKNDVSERDCGKWTQAKFRHSLLAIEQYCSSKNLFGL